jgi:hypothetical protein
MFGFVYPTPQPPEHTLVFFSFLTQFGSVRSTHNRQVEDGRPLPLESFWAHHIIDFYRVSINRASDFLSGRHRC